MVGQRSLLFCMFTSLGLLATTKGLAAEYYVSPSGSDTNAGTQAAPFATLQKANNTASAGDTIWMRGGTYSTTGQITLSKSGTSDTNRTKIWAYPGEVPVLNFSNYSLASSTSDKPAITVSGSWMHLKGLEIGPAKVGASGSHSYSLLRTSGSASNNTFELLNIHDAFGPGLFIDTGNGGNLILNCDSHGNYDINGSQGDGQNGDGFGVHYQTSGPSTIIRGCRAWANADDGYDLISQEIPVIIENSWAFRIGVGGGNGNGFKVGSSKTGIRHLVRQNVAWGNAAAGFYANHSSGGNTWYNNTSYNNGTQYNLLASSFDSSGSVTGTITLTGSLAHIMKNNIGYPNKNSNMGGVDTQFNTWDLGITPAASDFASISDTGCDGPRAADGSLPTACAILRLTAGSKMIDKGTNVGLPYSGSAPDLGAYEYGAAAVTGGTTGVGGAATGGAATGGTGGAAATGGRANAGGVAGAGGIANGGTATGGSVTAGGKGGTSAATAGAQASGGSTNLGGYGQGIGGANPASGGALGNGGTTTTTGSGGNTGSPGTGGAMATSSGGNSGTAAAGTGLALGDPVSGCSCRMASSNDNSAAWWLPALGGIGFVLRRRRNVTHPRTAERVNADETAGGRTWRAGVP
jgi:MYXO-CTERM domain-containing protein